MNQEVPNFDPIDANTQNPDSTFVVYIGCKLIKARPMTNSHFFETIKGQQVARDIEDSPGYLVEYPNGYLSWSPQNVFEEAYRPLSNYVHSAMEVSSIIEGTSFHFNL